MRNNFRALLAIVVIRSASEMRRPSRTLFVLALAWLLGPNTVRVQGQTYLQSVGVPTFTTRLPVEHGFINAANGALHLEIPMGSFPQRGGGQETISLVYDSNIWWSDPYYSAWQPTNVNNDGLGEEGLGNAWPSPWSGWRLVTSEHQGYVDCGATETDTNTLVCNPWIYVEPNGTVHSFDITTTFNGSYYTSDAGYASDGSGYYMSATAEWANVVRAPDGNVMPNHDGGSSYITTDTNGNQYPLVSYWNLYDTLNRTMVTTTSSGGGTTISYTVPNAQGSTSTYAVKLNTVNVDTNFGESGVSEYSGSITVVTEVDLPDGSDYQFQYDSGTTSGHYGQLTQMTLPTDGAINYTYNLVTDAQGNPYSWIHTRTSPDSSTGWTYSLATVGTTCTSGQVGCEQALTVTKPSSDTAVYTFVLNGGDWPIKTQYNSGSSTQLAQTTQCYTFVTVSSGSCSYSISLSSPAVNVKPAATMTTLSIPSGTVSATTEYAWDTNPANCYCELAQKSEWNFGTSVSGNPDRITNISYLSDSNSSYANANILNRPSSITVTNGAGTTTTAQTTYSYDGSSIASKTGMTNHDDTNYPTTNTVRGDVTAIKRYYDSSHYLQTLFAYDMTGQVTSSTDSYGNQTTYSSSDCFKNDNGTSSPSSASPSATNAYVTGVQTAISGISTSACYYYGTGQLATSTDANSNTTTHSYADSMNRSTTTWFPDGGWALNAYDGTSTETGLEAYTGITSTSPSTSCTSCRHDQTILDSLGLGRVGTQKLVSDPDYSGGTKTDFTYDADGRIHTVSNLYRTTSDSTYGLETLGYDGLDRVTQTENPDGSYAYTAFGAAVGSGVSQGCSTSSYGHGYPILYTDEAGKKRQTWTDAFGRTIETDEPDASGSLNLHTCYGYDLNNNLTGVLASDGSQIRSYSYDMLSRVTSKTEPESGTMYFYYTTAAGALCSGETTAICRRTDARSITTTYYYDALNRLEAKFYSDSTPTAYYYYDQSNCGISLSNYKGRLTTMGTNNGTWLTADCFNYDALGRVTNFNQYIAGNYLNISATYSLDGSLASVTYPSGRTVTYTVGNAGRPISATDTVNGINYAGASSLAMYAPTGDPASIVYGYVGSGTFTGITDSRTYNSRLQVTSIEATSATATALNLSFSYVSGNNGNLATQTNSLDTGRTQTYTYDTMNRLVTAQSQATSGGDCWGQNFGNNTTPPTLAADVLANLFYATSTQCSSFQPRFTPTASNQFSDSGFSYDSSGDMTADQTYSYTYDAEGRIATASGMSGGPYCYIYDVFDRRAEKANANGGACTGSPTVDVLYWRDSSGNALAETDSSGSTSNSSYREYVFFDGRRIARSDLSSSTQYYYFTDQLGSTRAMAEVNSANSPTDGTVCFSADYYPYGQEMDHTSSCGTNYRFTGYERDSETGLDYAFARYYNDRLGRFMSTDPAPGDITDPQTLNRYAYVRNNPTNLVDPTGLDDCEPEDPECTCVDVSCIYTPLPGPGGQPGNPGIGVAFGPPIVMSNAANTVGEQGGDPTAGEVDGIPNGLGSMTGTGPFGGCTYGTGACGGMINSWTAEGGFSIQITVWGLAIQGFYGLAIDSHGHLGIYKGGGGGIGLGAVASTGVSVSASNGNTVCALGGPFTNISGTAGLGAGGTVDVFTGKGDAPGGVVWGAGGTIGPTAGAAGGVTITGTKVQPIGHRCVDGKLQ